jgi:hypothetical protein
MRILHVANFSHRKYGADLYATDRKLSHGLIRCGHMVYDFSYRDVCRNESLLRTTRFATGALDKKLLLACERLAPQLLLLGHSELVSAKVLATIRRKHPSIKIALWYVDALFHRDKTGHLFIRRPHLDVIFATCGGEDLRELAGAGCTAAYFPNPVDRAVECHHADENIDYDHDFIFCGRDQNDPERQHFMATLKERASAQLRCTFRGCLGSPPLTGVDYLDFLGRSKMALNISRRNDVTLYSSDRLAQLLGNGLLTFCPRVPGLYRLFGEEHLVYFDNQDDLVEKLLHYHRHEAQCRDTARKGRQRAHQVCAVERVCTYMLETIFSMPYSSDYEWVDEVFPCT